MPASKSRCKEIRMAATLTKWADDDELVEYTTWGKQNPESNPRQCDKLLPDFTWDIDAEQRVVVLEFDEKAHRSYEVRCEFARAFKLAVGYKRPLHLIRYNCDELPRVAKLPETKEREVLLLSRLQAALAPATDDSRFAHAVTIEFLYYYDIPGSAAPAPFLQTLAFATHDDCEAWATTTIDELEPLNYRAVTRVNTIVWRHPPKE
jgi:hypothetical protein